MNRFCRVDFVLREEFGRRELEDVQAAGNLRSVDVAVVPIGRPIAAEHEHLRVDGPAVEVGNFEGMLRIGEIHDGDPALIPGLHFDIAAGNGDQRAVMSHAVFCVALRGGHFVVACEAQLVVLQPEDGVGAPLVGIVRAAARSQAAAPLVGEDDFAAVV